MGTTDRPPNLIDILRIFAAFSIVWYHSNYFYRSDFLLFQDSYRQFQVLVFYWAMPFFYTATAYFALVSNLKFPSWEQRFSRVTRVFSLLFVYSLLFEVPRLVMLYQGRLKNYSPFHMLDDGNSVQAIITALAKSIYQGNYSHLYFLSHVIIIYFLAILVSLLYRKLKLKVLFTAFFCGVVVVLLIGYEQNLTLRISQLLLLTNERALIATIVGFIFALVSAKVKKPLKLTPAKMIAVLLLLIFLLNGPEMTHLPTLLTFNVGSILFSTGLLLAGLHYTRVISPLLARLSRWGQRYSLGIFLLHPCVQMPLDNLVPLFFPSVSIPYREIVIIIVINLAAFALSQILVRLIYQYRPALVTL